MKHIKNISALFAAFVTILCNHAFAQNLEPTQAKFNINGVLNQGYLSSSSDYFKQNSFLLGWS